MVCAFLKGQFPLKAHGHEETGPLEFYLHVKPNKVYQLYCFNVEDNLEKDFFVIIRKKIVASCIEHSSKKRNCLWSGLVDVICDISIKAQPDYPSTSSNAQMMINRPRYICMIDHIEKYYLLYLVFP